MPPLVPELGYLVKEMPYPAPDLVALTGWEEFYRWAVTRDPAFHHAVSMGEHMGLSEIDRLRLIVRQMTHKGHILDEELSALLCRSRVTPSPIQGISREPKNQCGDAT